MRKNNILNWNNNRVSKLKNKIINYDNDDEKEKRLKQCLCKYCTYINVDKIAGQAFAKVNCLRCGTEMVFPTTDTNDYCEVCAKSLNVCKHCGSLMD